VILALAIAAVLVAAVAVAVHRMATPWSPAGSRTARENGWSIVLMLDAALLLLTAVALSLF
jgi:hypothetical protein